jgi:hypothetical protein
MASYGTNVETLLNEILRTLRAQATNSPLATEATLLLVEGAVDSVESEIGQVNTNLTSLLTLTGNIETSLETLSAPFAPSQFRSLTVNSTAQAIKGTSGAVYGWNIINLHSSTIYVKLYDIAAASVNPASSVPVRTLMVPANGAVIEKSDTPWGVYSTAISVRAVTESGDTGTTAPGTLPIIEIIYT